MTDAEASPFGCAGVTTFNALRRGGAEPGDRVAVAGIGGLGHLAVQFAAAMGHETVAVGCGEEKRRAALDLGAHHYVDANAEEPGAALHALGGVRLIVSTAAVSSALLAGLVDAPRSGAPKAWPGRRSAGPARWPKSTTCPDPAAPPPHCSASPGGRCTTRLRGGGDRRLARMFGPDAARPETLHVQDWSAEKWTSPPVVRERTNYGLFGHACYQGPALTGRLHWASTETAADHAGHIEGASTPAGGPLVPSWRSRRRGLETALSGPADV
ncbi:zinc-binding dehydrogenase [Micromonospora sp. CPCC 206060]|uniref:zinc-binding dehydrogenase n=1 Tax=Micromonospora sp. CPCC 206060 TaxID=3122406 RepID=UPI002FF0BCD7